MNPWIVLGIAWLLVAVVVSLICGPILNRNGKRYSAPPDDLAPLLPRRPGERR